jgi:DNA-binding NtrC family response regulator
VYGIIRQSGGFVTVDSRPGTGTTFRLYLPAIEAANKRALKRQGKRSPPRGTETVLLCEDDAPVRRLIERMLRDAGYHVLSAAIGSEAIRMSSEYEGRIHLLVTDVIMPDCNGREVSNAVRGSRPELETLFVSGYATDVIAHHGVLDEGLEFLPKPFSRQAFLKRVRDLLDHRTEARESRRESADSRK